MIIKNTELVSMSEALEYMKEDKENNAEVIGFVKKFTELKPKEAKEIRKKIQNLNLMKAKPEYIVKIIDLMPETNEDLNKIFVDVSLDEDESKKILEIIKEFK